MSNVVQQNTEPSHKHPLPLFDQDGLPWSSRLSWGWLLVAIAILSFTLTPLMGIYIGLWLRSKGRSSLTLVLYIVITSLCLVLINVGIPATGPFKAIPELLGALMLALWFVGAFVLRHEVASYYRNRESIPFELSPTLTALFGPWYIGGYLRADFPLDEDGKIGSGTLKLIN